MKTEFVDVSETRKNVRVEISTDVVNAEIDRIARDYSRKARVPGFRPGKTPPRVIKQRFKDQILHDVVHDLIPRAVDDALREQGLEAVDTPDVRDVTIEEGRPLTFTASFDTLPSFDPGDLSTIQFRRASKAINEEAVQLALQRLRDRAARFEPVEGRGVDHGDTVVLDLERRDEGGRESARNQADSAQGGRESARNQADSAQGGRESARNQADSAQGGRESARNQADSRPPDIHKDVSIELGAKANPPGFDEQLLGLEVGATKAFIIHYPADYPIGELANTDVSYTVTVKGLKRRVLPELDDEFAKDLGEFDTLDALTTRVREDLEHEAKHAAEREDRAELMKQLATRLPFEVPASLVDREVDRRLEEFARRLIDQKIDPRQAGIDWNAFRESQREVARAAVAAALVLDEVTRREQLDVTEDEVEREVGRYAERSGRTPAAARAALEKEGGMARVHAGLRREKSIDFVLARATIAGDS
jgi:trigger factor